MTDPTERFSARADVYARARPSYPAAVLDVLRNEYGLRDSSVVADVGSGTGISTRLLLDAAARVYAVEPNADMRAEAERALGSNSHFVSVNGRAEATTLPDASVDLVTAAQAFHWFDVEAARREHGRILKEASHAAFIWNDRHLTGTPFLALFERILVEYAPQYPMLQGKADTPDKYDAYFGIGKWRRHEMPNSQSLDREALVARVMSSSYAPRSGQPNHVEMVRDLESAFDRYAQNGTITIAYSTIVIGGKPLRGS